MYRELNLLNFNLKAVEEKECTTKQVEDCSHKSCSTEYETVPKEVTENQCKQVLENQCHKTPTDSCKTELVPVTHFEDKQVCETKSVEVCKAEEQPDCKTVNRNDCKTVSKVSSGKPFGLRQQLIFAISHAPDRQGTRDQERLQDQGDQGLQGGR
jgi:hypothetical protein